jgi:hypothetical protein
MTCISSGVYDARGALRGEAGSESTARRCMGIVQVWGLVIAMACFSSGVYCAGMQGDSGGLVSRTCLHTTYRKPHTCLIRQQVRAAYLIRAYVLHTSYVPHAPHTAYVPHTSYVPNSTVAAEIRYERESLDYCIPHTCRTRQQRRQLTRRQKYAEKPRHPSSSRPLPPTCIDAMREERGVQDDSALFNVIWEQEGVTMPVERV